MKILDRVYGEQELTAPILLELIETPELDRLKRIVKFGLPLQINNFQTNSRYEHSLGVLLLLKQVGAGLEEQIAGLLHDVSHSAFSHLIDWIYGSELKENHQDEVFHERMMNSSLPVILDSNGFDVSRITHHENYPLLEQEAPLLCADRVDYALREMALYRNPGGVSLVRDSLIANGRIMFNNRGAAEIFARDYMACQTEHWGAIEFKTRWRLLSEALKSAMQDCIVSYEDLFTDDFAVLEKLEGSQNPTVRENLNLLKSKFDIVEDPEGTFELKKKFRYVDPEFLEDGRVYRVTEVNPEYRKRLEYEMERGKMVQRVKIVS